MRVFVFSVILLFSSDYNRCHGSDLVDEKLNNINCFQSSGSETDDDYKNVKYKTTFIQSVKIGKPRRSTKTMRSPKAPKKKVEKNFPASGKINNKAKKKLF